MVYKNTNIKIVVKDNFTETAGYRSVVFERPNNFNYESGDWIDIQFSNAAFKGGKTYSLSSSPTDADIMITFKDGLSDIKKALATVKPGDILTIIQYGNDYKFALKTNKSSTLIAGGVGIAPFRGMIKEMVALHNKNEVKLIYMNKTEEFLFKQELEAWENELPGLSVTYIATNDLNKKARTKALLGAVSTFRQSFYIAGPEGMVETTEHLLIDQGVDIADIKIDSFGGY